MNFFLPKEAKIAISILDEMALTDETVAFRLVREVVEKMIRSHAQDFADIIRKGASPRAWVYSAVSNIAGDMVSSGEFHVYRGYLNPMGPGEDLLCLYDKTVDELIKMGHVDAAYAAKQKQGLRESIREVG